MSKLWGMPRARAAGLIALSAIAIPGYVYTVESGPIRVSYDAPHAPLDSVRWTGARVGETFPALSCYAEWWSADSAEASIWRQEWRPVAPHIAEALGAFPDKSLIDLIADATPESDRAALRFAMAMSGDGGSSPEGSVSRPLLAALSLGSASSGGAGGAGGGSGGSGGGSTGGSGGGETGEGSGGGSGEGGGGSQGGGSSNGGSQGGGSTSGGAGRPGSSSGGLPDLVPGGVTTEDDDPIIEIGDGGNGGPSSGGAPNTVAAVPIPAAAPLLLFAIAALGFASRRRKAA